MSVPFEREPPPVITQSSATRCWAAALESWMQAEQMQIVLTQERLVDVFRTVPGALERNSDRATTEVGASLMTHFTWMNAGLFSGSRLTANFWGNRLATGYIFLWYARGGVGHCGVVYGVTRSVVKLMDPWQGRGLTEKKVDFFLSCQNALVGVSMFSHHVRNPFIGIFDNAPAAAPQSSSSTGLPGYNF
jgi:hypothetical protein